MDIKQKAVYLSDKYDLYEFIREKKEIPWNKVYTIDTPDPEVAWYTETLINDVYMDNCISDVEYWIREAERQGIDINDDTDNYDELLVFIQENI